MHDTLTGYGVQNLGKSKLRGMWESITRRRWEGLEVLYGILAVVDVHTFRERERVFLQGDFIILFYNYGFITFT